MSKVTFKNYINRMRQTIFIGERLEKNMKAIATMGMIIAAGGFIMTLMNILQKKGFVTYTTAAIMFFGLFIVYGIKIRKNRQMVVFSIMFISLVTFTYYSISGVNDGFAILWTLLMPVAVSFLIGALYGISLSIILEVLFIILFWTPVRAQMAEYYTVTFMNRYPILYLVGIFLNTLAVSSYHLSTLSEIEYEKKLKEAAEAAIAADKAKSDFLAQMSHEIRTPINAVLGMNEMVIRETSEEQIKEYALDIQVAGRNLLSIINTILDFSKIEDGKMEIIPVEYDLASVLNNLINSIAARAKAKSLEFKIDVDENLPVTLFGDDVRITQVVTNLLTNAVKYTEKGSVSLSVSEVSRNENKVIIRTVVSDTGIGIRSTDMEKLFESFGRLDVKRNRGIEGTGLGMAIVVNLLRMMGSKLEVESEYGRGSTFSFNIEQDIVDASPVGKYNERFERSSRQVSSDKYLYAPAASILVVDDNEMNCKVVKNLLKRNGIVPDFAFSGMEAIEKIRNKTYNIVLLDHMMPKMDGVETLRSLHEQDLIPDETKIIVLTANAVIGAKEQYLELGFDDYLSKPVETEGLEEKLAQYLPEELTEWKRVTDEGTKAPVKGSSDDVMEFDASDDVMEFGPDNGEKVQESSGPSKSHILAELIDMGFDTEAGLKYSAGNMDFYIEILQEFASTYSAKKDRLEEYYRSGDMKEYKTLVHSMKSASKTLGKNDVSEKALELELAAGREDSSFIKANHSAFTYSYSDMGRSLEKLLYDDHSL